MATPAKLADVSQHNGSIDWVAFARSGYGAIIRVGYGDDVSFQDDKRFTANVEGCIRNGVPFGLYLYSYALSEKQLMSEINHMLRLAEPYRDKLSFPVYWDSEEKGTEGIARKGMRVWCDSMAARGYHPGVYASASWWASYLGSAPVGCSRWAAAWHAESLGQPDCDLWQYTNKGSVPGIVGNVDMNVNYALSGSVPNAPSDDAGDVEAKAIAASMGEYGNGEARKLALGRSYYDVQARVNQYYRIARRVVRGDYGNGEARKTRLIAAGFDPATVQHIVNESYYS